MNPHPPRSAPPAPLRLSLYAWAAGLFLGALEGALAIGVAGVRGSALPLVGAVAAAMVLGTVTGRPLARYLGRRRMGLLMGALAVLGAGVAAGLGGVGLIGAGLVGLAVGGVLVVAPLVCHELSLRGHKRLMPQAMALGPAGAGVVVLAAWWSPSRLLIAWVVVAVASLAYLVGALLLPESPVWLVRQGRDVEAFEALRRLHGTLEASVAIDWTRLDAEMMAEQQVMSPSELRVPEVRAAVLTGAVLIIAQEAPLGAAALVLAPLIATELGLAPAAIAISAGTWMGLALLALALVTRVERLRFLRVVLGTVVAVLGATFLVTGMTLGGAGGAWMIIVSLTILVASQSVLVLPACQGAIDPRIPPWLVEAQRRASATGGVLARAGVLLASLLIVSYLGTRALFWVVFTLSVLSVAVVLLRLPRELKV
ncbi:MFS transporter [Actinomyces oris]|uniref:MFS transporter n=1 Tax=Actinomyces oris TaxID=544580 RepID=A0AAW9KMS4_9ACTO|nr:MFS transporter [Actinomyces oris]MEA1303678.1 MFS transporter [Actinomyces oris]